MKKHFVLVWVLINYVTSIVLGMPFAFARGLRLDSDRSESSGQVDKILEPTHPESDTLTRVPFCTELVWNSSAPNRATVEFGIAKGTRPVPLTCIWETDKIMKVRFLEGSTELQNRVISVANQWSQHSGIEFEFLKSNSISNQADVRITFNPFGGYWSYVGSCTPQEQSFPTMNLGDLDTDTPKSEFERVVLHEFGHACALLHEHTHPQANIPWNKDAVYAYYLRTQGWSKEVVDANILDPATGPLTLSDFDKKSIMEYPIPAEVTLNGFSIPWNEKLSDGDKAFIRKLYPPADTASSASSDSSSSFSSRAWVCQPNDTNSILVLVVSLILMSRLLGAT